MKIGSLVKLQAYGDEILTRKLIQQNKDTVIVCSTEEYDKAQLEGRKPICVGFHVKYVLEQRQKQ